MPICTHIVYTVTKHEKKHKKIRRKFVLSVALCVFFIYNVFTYMFAEGNMFLAETNEIIQFALFVL